MTLLARIFPIPFQSVLQRSGHDDNLYPGHEAGSPTRGGEDCVGVGVAERCEEVGGGNGARALSTADRTIIGMPTMGFTRTLGEAGSCVACALEYLHGWHAATPTHERCPMQIDCLLPGTAGLQLTQVQFTEAVILVTVTATSPAAACPLCTHVSTRVGAFPLRRG